MKLVLPTSYQSNLQSSKRAITFGLRAQGWSFAALVVIAGGLVEAGVEGGLVEGVVALAGGAAPCRGDEAAVSLLPAAPHAGGGQHLGGLLARARRHARVGPRLGRGLQRLLGARRRRGGLGRLPAAGLALGLSSDGGGGEEVPGEGVGRHVAAQLELLRLRVHLLLTAHSSLA